MSLRKTSKLLIIQVPGNGLYGFFVKTYLTFVRPVFFHFSNSEKYCTLFFNFDQN